MKDITRAIQFKAYDAYHKTWITNWKRVLPAHYQGEMYPIEHGGINYNCVYVPVFDIEVDHYEEIKDLLDTKEWMGDCDLLLVSSKKDTNGKIIAEGDILLNHIMGDLWLVVFKDDCFMISLIGKDLDEYLYKVEGFEIVGNKYDTPHLLEVRS